MVRIDRWYVSRLVDQPLHIPYVDAKMALLNRYAYG